MEVQMSNRNILISLICLGWLLLTGCTATPEEVATIPATQANSATIAPTLTTVPLADTPAATVTFEATPIPTATPTLSFTDLRATYTAEAAAYTPPPTETATPTSTPSPTFTPIPGPVWPILFAGVPCAPDHPYCADPERYEPMQWYQIYSDGSGFRPVDQLENPDLVIQDIRFSPDGSLKAYWAASSEQRHLFLAGLDNQDPMELVVVPAEQGYLMQGFDFMPGTGCLVVWWSDFQQATEFETVSMEQVCPGQAEPQVLGVFELPFRSGGYLLSPQGDAFLLHSRDSSDNLYLYIQEIGEASPPILLFMSENEVVSISPRRWHPDGQSIEFILNSYDSPSYDNTTIIQYVISRDGQAVETYPILEDVPFGLCCGWSPDGREILSALLDNPSDIAGIYVFNLDESTWRHVLPAFYADRGPIWSPEMP
jgi:hypothetical protein